MTKHLVVDVRMARHGGIGTYIRNVVPRVIAERPNWRFTLIANDAAAQWAWGDPSRVSLARSSADIYTIGEQLELFGRIPRDADLFWAPHYNIPVLSRPALAVTIHDVAHLALPEIHRGMLKQAYARGMLGAVKRRAGVVLFDSEFTSAEFRRMVGEPARSAAIPLGVDSVWRSAAPPPPVGVTRPYLLFVGSVKPHKNLARLVRAYASLVPGLNHDLVIVGPVAGQRSIDTNALTLAAALGDRVHLVGTVSDVELRSYVAHATALVLPSLYEGFGLPALEAMAAGCPCLVSRVASLPEVCGEAALYCDPMSEADLASRIAELLSGTDLQARLRAAGRHRASLFTWDETARRTAAALEPVVERGRE